MVCGIAGTAAFLIVWNRLYTRTNEYRSRCGDRIKMFHELPESGLDGIVIGSSQAYYDFDFEMYGYSIVNLSGNPQALQPCCYIVKENISRVKKGGVLLICLPFAGGVFRGYADRLHNEVYYSILRDCRVIGGYGRIKRFIYRCLPVLGNWKNFFRIFHDYPGADDNCGDIPGHDEIRLLIEDRIREWKRLTGVDIRTEEFTTENRCQLEENMRLLKDTIRICEEDGINPVIITPPIMDAFYQVISEGFWINGYREPLRRLADETGIGFMDFCGERLYGGDPQMFRGIDFLNMEGKKKLTEETIGRLKGMGLL